MEIPYVVAASGRPWFLNFTNELVADKGIVSKEEVLERLLKLKAETTVNFRRVTKSAVPAKIVPPARSAL